MKLETMMVNEDGEWVPKADTDFFPGMELKHDAAAAHALMQSLNEHVGDHTNLSLCIIRRAGDILAEWGFADGSR